MCETFNSKLWRRKNIFCSSEVLSIIAWYHSHRAVWLLLSKLKSLRGQKLKTMLNLGVTTRCEWLSCFVLSHTLKIQLIRCSALNMLVSLRCGISLLWLREVSVSSQFIYEQKSYTQVSAEVKKIGLLPLWYVNQKVLLFTVRYYNFLNYIIFWRDSKVNPK